MKLYRSRILLGSVLACVLATGATAQGRKGPRSGPPLAGSPSQAGLYTTVSGTISQFNYDPDAEIEGFLLNNNTLVHLPPRAAPRIASAVKTGDSVQIAGYAETYPTGLRKIEAQSVEDRTSGKTITVPQPGAAAPYSGSGRIRQLNYDPEGAINGFWLDDGTFARIPSFSGSNPTSVHVGTNIVYSGYARNTISGHTVVDVQNIAMNGHPVALGAGGTGPGAPPQPASAGPPPPAPGNTPPPPSARTDQPPPPPPPR